MLMVRVVAVTDEKIDRQELLEKAEIRFLELVGHETGQSNERIVLLMSSLAHNG